MNLLKRTTVLLFVTLVLGTAGCGKSSGDAAITDRVKTAISKEPALKVTKVSVSTNESVVHLSGTVKSRDERAMLIAVARKVDGVKAVKTDLTVAAQEKPAAKPQQKTAVKPKQTTTAKAQQKKPAAEARAKQKPQAQLGVKPDVKPHAQGFAGTGR
jgi:BON domain